MTACHWPSSKTGWAAWKIILFLDIFELFFIIGFWWWDLCLPVRSWNEMSKRGTPLHLQNRKRLTSASHALKACSLVFFGAKGLIHKEFSCWTDCYRSDLRWSAQPFKGSSQPRTQKWMNYSPQQSTLLYAAHRCRFFFFRRKRHITSTILQELFLLPRIKTDWNRITQLQQSKELWRGPSIAVRTKTSREPMNNRKKNKKTLAWCVNVQRSQFENFLFAIFVQKC